MKTQEAAALAADAMAAITRRIKDLDEHVAGRTVERAADVAWRGDAGIADGSDGIAEAAVAECSERVRDAFASGAARPETLLLEGGASELAPSPDLVALWARWRERRLVFAFDDELEGLLEEFSSAADGSLDDLKPASCFVGWRTVLDRSDGSPRLPIGGFFAMTWFEGTGDPAAKRTVLAAVEDGPRRRIVVADLSDVAEEDGYGLALIAAAEAPLRHLASARPDVGMPERECNGPRGTTACTVGAHMGPEVRKRRRLEKAKRP